MTPEQAAANAKPGLATLVGAFAESPQTLRRARLMGLSGWAYHVSARAGALGDVRPETVAAAIGFIAPDAVTDGWEAAAKTTPPVEVATWHLHELCRDSFVGLHLTDARRRPPFGPDPDGLRQVVVSRWDAPHDSGLRDRAYFDPGSAVRERFGLGDVAVLLRPDGHVAFVEPWTAGSWRNIQDRYLREVCLER